MPHIKWTVKRTASAPPGAKARRYKPRWNLYNYQQFALGSLGFFQVYREFWNSSRKTARKYFSFSKSTDTLYSLDIKYSTFNKPNKIQVFQTNSLRIIFAHHKTYPLQPGILSWRSVYGYWTVPRILFQDIYIFFVWITSSCWRLWSAASLCFLSVSCFFARIAACVYVCVGHSIVFRRHYNTEQKKTKKTIRGCIIFILLKLSLTRHNVAASGTAVGCFELL